MEPVPASCRCAICALIEARPDGMFDQRVLVVVACGHPQADEMGDDSVVAR
jgi:hypothetical protein